MPGTNHGDTAAADALWRFSLALYARPGVAKALLALQDRAGHNVNLVLFAVWLGATQGRAINAESLAAAHAATAPPDAVTRRIRAFRRELTAADDTVLRRRVLVLELAAERRAQRCLAELLAALPDLERSGDRLAIAERNLACCLGEAAGSAEADVLCHALSELMRVA